MRAEVCLTEVISQVHSVMAMSERNAHERTELQCLYAEYAVAVNRALAVAQTEGMFSQAFLEADGRAGEVRRRIREIGGLAGEHWMT